MSNIVIGSISLRQSAHRGRMSEMNYCGTPFNERQRQRTAQLTGSNAVFGSGKTKMVDPWTIYLCFKICSKVRIFSIQPKPGREPDRFSSTNLSKVLDNQCRTMAASILDAIINELIPLWFPREDLSPFFQIGTITNLPQSLGISPLSELTSVLLNPMLTPGHNR